jgi:MinD-like ATPase involved in chromosome partitioning or flagellar assembly
MRRLGSGVRRAVGGGAGTEAREAADIKARLSRAVASCRQIAVVSVRGGAGKTTITALTAEIMAEHRTDRVLAVDADSGLGSLPLRLGVRPNRALADIVTAPTRSWEETSALLTRSGERLWVLPGSLDGRMAAELNLGAFQAAYGRLSRYFSTALVDCGAGIHGELQRGVLGTAHAQLLITPGTVDGAISAMSALDWFATHGQAALLRRTVVVLVTHSPHADADLARVQDMLSTNGMPVFHLPYDRHLAGGAAIDLSRVSTATRTAAVRIADEVFTLSLGA